MNYPECIAYFTQICGDGACLGDESCHACADDCGECLDGCGYRAGSEIEYGHLVANGTGSSLCAVGNEMVEPSGEIKNYLE